MVDSMSQYRSLLVVYCVGPVFDASREWHAGSGRDLSRLIAKSVAAARGENGNSTMADGMRCSVRQADVDQVNWY